MTINLKDCLLGEVVTAHLTAMSGSGLCHGTINVMCGVYAGGNHRSFKAHRCEIES